ncbi:MAG: alpha/beta hydrolase [Myxococcota bacterium]
MNENVADRSQRFDLRQPSSYLKWLELRAVLEAAALLPAAPLLLSQPRGDGHRVIVFPGFLFGDRSTWALRMYLRALGYDAVTWGLGANRGRPERDAKRVVQALRDEDTDNSFSVIGWSLGGVVARLVAMALPSRTRQVITMGTPVEGGPKYTATANVFARRNGLDLDAFEHHVHKRNSEGLKPPITAIYSKSDAVVGWQAAIDRYNPQAQHRRIIGSHLGLGLNPLVFLTVARTLGSLAA